MTQFKVTLKTTNGDSTYVMQGGSMQQVSTQVEQTVKDRADVVQYTVEQAGQPQLTPNSMHELYKATGGLVACIIILVVAEFKIRQWLKG
jgi:multidrug efflux pump subunit AcrB